jgi:Amt family ammonium transporter
VFDSSNAPGGVFSQLGAQALGVAVAFTCVFVVSYAVFALIKATIGLRVTEVEEDAGLDISEHGMYGYPEQFIPQPEYSTGLPTHSAPVPTGAPAPAVSQMASAAAHMSAPRPESGPGQQSHSQGGPSA